MESRSKRGTGATRRDRRGARLRARRARGGRVSARLAGPLPGRAGRGDRRQAAREVRALGALARRVRRRLRRFEPHLPRAVAGRLRPRARPRRPPAALLQLRAAVHVVPRDAARGRLAAVVRVAATRVRRDRAAGARCEAQGGEPLHSPQPRVAHAGPRLAVEPRGAALDRPLQERLDEVGAHALQVAGRAGSLGAGMPLASHLLGYDEPIELDPRYNGWRPLEAEAEEQHGQRRERLVSERVLLEERIAALRAAPRSTLPDDWTRKVLAALVERVRAAGAEPVFLIPPPTHHAHAATPARTRRACCRTSSPTTTRPVTRLLRPRLVLRPGAPGPAGRGGLQRPLRARLRGLLEERAAAD